MSNKKKNKKNNSNNKKQEEQKRTKAKMTRTLTTEWTRRKIKRG